MCDCKVPLVKCSGGSRPLDKGGPVDPDPEIRGGGPWPQKKIFHPFGPHFGLKIRGGGGSPGPPPGSATEMYPNPNTLNFGAK